MNFDLDLGSVIAEARGSLAKYKENKTYSKETYEELLEKYSSAITVIELLKKEIEQLKTSNQMPNKNDIETMGALLNLMGIDKLDSEGIQKINNLSKEFGEK